MRAGDVIEQAFWLDGTETKALLDKYRGDVRQQIDDLCNAKNVLYGDVAFTEKQIGDDRVPVPPDHIQGPNVRLLVAEARITGPKPRPPSFIGDLDPKDLDRLRRTTRRIYGKYHKDRHGKPLWLDDAACDEIIDSLGPDAALATLKEMN